MEDLRESKVLLRPDGSMFQESVPYKRPTRSREQISEFPEDALRQIEKMVRSFLKGVIGIDEENLSVDIWVELWQEKRPLTWMHIRHRCIDEIRARMRSRLDLMPNFSLDERMDSGKEDVGFERIDKLEYLDLVMRMPSLIESDKRILFLHFYQGLKCEDIGNLLGLSKSSITSKIRKTLKDLREWASLLGLDKDEDKDKEQARC